jgi:hypothetical protein
MRNRKLLIALLGLFAGLTLCKARAPHADVQLRVFPRLQVDDGVNGEAGSE